MELLTTAGRLLATINAYLKEFGEAPTMDKLAIELGITTRAVQETIVNLREAGYITTIKVGRRVRYTVEKGRVADIATGLRAAAGEP